MMRAHGLRPREPWAFGPEVLAIARRFLRLRYRLRPYLRRVGAEATARGLRPARVTEHVALDRLPVLVREGADPLGEGAP